jgi:hypothetical protein
MREQEQPSQIDRDYIRLLLVMRRFVREEYEIKIQISETGAIEKLLHYAGQSANVVLQEMGKELREILSHDSDDRTPATERTVHYYRGIAQPVVTESPQRKKEHLQEAPKTRIYRGQVVAG